MQRLRWLTVAVVLFVVAVLLMRSGEQPGLTTSARTKPKFPGAPTKAERVRNAERRTLLHAAPGLEAADGPSEPVPTDPMAVALGVVVPKGADVMVIEASAIRHSPLGEMMLECMSEHSKGELEEMGEELGFDPVENLDRVAVSDRGLVVTGAFEGLRERLSEKKSGLRPYGDHGVFEEQANGKVVVLWRDEMFAFVSDLTSAEQLVDRLEGRAAGDPYALDRVAYGEAYGQVGPARLAEFVPDEQPELRQKVLQTLEGVEIHLDAQGDPAVTMRARGEDAVGVDELARVMGGAFSLGRATAKVQGNEELAALLEHARVAERRDGAFSLEFSMPLEVVRDRLLKCAPKSAAKAAKGETPLLDAGS